MSSVFVHGETHEHKLPSECKIKNKKIITLVSDHPKLVTFFALIAVVGVYPETFGRMSQRKLLKFSLYYYFFYRIYAIGIFPVLAQGEVFTLAHKVSVSSRRRSCMKHTKIDWYWRRAGKKNPKPPKKTKACTMFPWSINDQKATWTKYCFEIHLVRKNKPYEINYKPGEWWILTESTSEVF